MAATDKRYFWLKLKRDFFRRHDIRYLESLEDGHEISLFYLKLLCESVDHEGRLRFSEELPYNAKILAGIFDVSEELATKALEELEALHLIRKEADGTLYMLEIDGMIGHETYWAKRKREKRTEDEEQEELEGVGQTLDTVGQTLDTVGHFPTSQGKSKSKSKSKSLSNDKDYESTSPQQVVELYAQICHSFPAVKFLSDARRKAIKARLNSYTLEDFKTLFEKAEASDFLKGANDRDWRASFDWLIKDTNMAKVLDGNYDNQPRGSKKGKQTSNPFKDFPQNEYDFDDLEKKIIRN